MRSLCSADIVLLRPIMDVLPPPTLSEDVMATLNAASRLTYFLLSKIYALVRSSPAFGLCSALDDAWDGCEGCWCTQ